MRMKTELLRQRLAPGPDGEGEGEGSPWGLTKLRGCNPDCGQAARASRSPRPGPSRAARPLRASRPASAAAQPASLAPRPEVSGTPGADAAARGRGPCGSARGSARPEGGPRPAHLMCVKCTSKWGAASEAREPQALRSAAGRGPSRCTSAIFYTDPLPPPPPPPPPPLQAPNRK